MPVTLTPEIRARLNDETDARFWASTAFKIGQKLDMTNPLDKKMSAVWAHIYAIAKQQVENGTIKWTHDDAVVHQAIADAQAHAADQATHLASAAAAPTPEAKRDAVKAAEASHEAAQVAIAPVVAVATAPGPGGRTPPPIVTKGTHELSKQAAHEIRQFVMNGAGMGVPTGPWRPEDAAAVMAATSAPATIATQVGDTALAVTPVADVAVKTASKIPWKTVGIVGGIAAALGIGAYFVSQRSTHRRVAHAR